MKIWAFDIETIINCFTVTFVDVNDESNVKAFVISSLEEFRLAPSRHKIQSAKELVDFMNSLSKDDMLVGFNSLNFDMPILSRVYAHASLGQDKLELQAYVFAQSIITEESNIPVHHSWAARQVPHLDLFKLHHFDNEAKRTSLKWIQCHLNMENIQDMPREHYIPVISMEHIQDVLRYNLNDVIATARLYNNQKTRDLIELRRWAIDKYSLTTGYNTSNSHMGERVFISLLDWIRPADKNPNPVQVKDFLIPLTFSTFPFKKIYSKFKALVISPGERFSARAVLDGMMYEFGLGGIHAARENSISENIQSVDVKSFYPNIAIQFGFRPKHVGERFTEIYKNLYNERMKTANPVHNAGLKESLNSVFGKSNSEFSPLYDPSFTYSITINGQLLIAILCERITTMKAGQIIMANTDGIEVKIYDEPLFNKILTAWSEKFKMPLSLSKYRKLIIRDVNNYIGIYENGMYKTKGAYEITKDFHKDPSAKICAQAVLEYYLHNTPIRATVMRYYFFAEFLDHTESKYTRFHMYRRAKTGKFVGISSDGSSEFELPKTLRYIVSKKGFILYHVTDSMKSKIHSDAFVMDLNDLSVTETHTGEPPIDADWYIKEANKLLVTKKLTLFI